MTIVSVALAEIYDNPFQTRTTYDPAGIEELARDIAANGLLQIPIGRQLRPDRVELAFGHRRLRAYRWLSAQPDHHVLLTMPVDLRDLDDQHMAQLAWAENQQRRDITAIEQAEAIERMMTAFGWTQGEVAERLGIARPTVANKLRLLKLPEDVRAQLRAGVLAERQAAALLPLFELPPDRLKALQRHFDVIHQPEHIVKAAAESSSDSIRSAVSAALRQISVPLTNAPFVAHVFDDFAERKFHAPTCAGCKQTITNDTGSYCLDQTCFTRKQAAYQEARVAAASAATGIPPREPGSGTDGLHFAGLPAAEIKAIVERPCTNLRLHFDDSAYTISPRLADFPDVAIACTKGSKCKCVAEYNARVARANPGEGQRQLSDAERKRVIKEAQERYFPPARKVIETALQADDVEVWRKLAKLADNNIKKPENLDLAACREAIAAAVLRNGMGWAWQNNPNELEIRDTVEEAVTKLGLPAPWELPPSELLARRLRKARANIRRIIGYDFDGRTAQALTAFEEEARAIAAEADAGGFEEIAHDAYQLARMFARVRDLLPLKSNGSYYNVERLLDGAPTSTIYQKSLTQQSVDDLRLALALTPDDGDDRQAAIRNRLAELGWQAESFTPAPIPQF